MTDLMNESDTSVEELAGDLFISTESLRSLEACGHVIGLHSHSHPTQLGELTDEEQQMEYEVNYEVLSSLLSAPPFSVAHPCNSYNSSTLTILRELGIRVGFRSNMAKVQASNLEFPRMDGAHLS
jgi:peptidoglycan/xylan/chitin deacetylase (PgdA/CDA1 family)